MGTGRETQARANMMNFRQCSHKPVIYAAWDWESIAKDALHQTGFAPFEEQARAFGSTASANLGKR